MKTKRLVTLSLLAGLMGSTLFAKPVSADKAAIVANHFFSSVKARHKPLADITANTPFTELYVFADTSDKGFVIIANDDCVPPIVGYSTTNTFQTAQMPSGMRLWFDNYEQQIRYARTHNADQNAKTVAAEWEKLLGGTAQPKNGTSVTPLLTTTWGQGYPYNALCPYDPAYGTNTLVGCTATAMAQVMKFWNHPSTGYGSHSYYSNYGTLSADFANTSYDWPNMPDILFSNDSSSHINAVATLMSHAGIAIDMNYSTYSSNSYITHFGDINTPCAENAMVQNFKYSPMAHTVSRSIYGDSIFATIVRNDLDNGRPVLTIGQGNDGGHIFVIDGYDASGLFHLNWGWNDFCDGYYAINDLNPTSDGYLSHYDRDNHIIANVQPNLNFGTGGTISATTNNSSLGSVVGGGSYAFGGTLSIQANANSGCRFVQWDDYGNTNPRNIKGTGGDYSLTAQFERMQGDTLCYASNLHLTNWGTTANEIYWGCKYPSAIINANRAFRAAQLFVSVVGNYSMTIYCGTNSPTQTLASVNFSVSDNELFSWKTIELPNPVAIPSNKNLWVTFRFENTSGNWIYPAACSYYCGNPDGTLWSRSFASIANTSNVTFLIKTLFTPNYQRGDTLSYTFEAPYKNHYGNGQDSFSWGCKFPASAIAGTDSLHQIRLFTPNIGNADYTFNIYQGGDETPDSLCFSHTVNLPGDSNYHTLTLSPSLPLDQNRPLWVTVTAPSSSMPAAYASGNGYSDGNWYLSSTDNTWHHFESDNTPIGWLIECVTARTVLYSVQGLSNNYSWGTVTGSGFFQYGDTTTITAVPSSDAYRFVRWLDGDTNISRPLVVKNDTIFYAFFDHYTGIDNAVERNISFKNLGNTLIVYGAEGLPIDIYDPLGRLLAHCDKASTQERFELPLSKLCIVQIPDFPPRKIILHK